jgi:hypothetical protein
LSRHTIRKEKRIVKGIAGVMFAVKDDLALSVTWWQDHLEDDSTDEEDAASEGSEEQAEVEQEAWVETE